MRWRACTAFVLMARSLWHIWAAERRGQTYSGLTLTLRVSTDVKTGAKCPRISSDPLYAYSVQPSWCMRFAAT